MAKSNKMGMTNKQLAANRAARMSVFAKEKHERKMAELEESGLNKIIDDLQAGKITKEEAVEALRNIS